MGNKNNSPNKEHQIVVNLRQRTIILHYAYKLKLEIGDAPKFPHNYEGLRLWDSNIVMSRYIILHSSIFKDK